MKIANIIAHERPQSLGIEIEIRNRNQRALKAMIEPVASTFVAPPTRSSFRLHIFVCLGGARCADFVILRRRGRWAGQRILRCVGVSVNTRSSFANGVLDLIQIGQCMHAHSPGTNIAFAIFVFHG